MKPTINAIRRYLYDRGCLEVREFEMGGMRYIETVCKMKTGKRCRGVLVYEEATGYLPPRALDLYRRALAPRLGQRWTSKVPPEDPFR